MHVMTVKIIDCAVAWRLPAVFWDMVSCTDRCQSTWCDVPEGKSLHQHCCDNPASHTVHYMLLTLPETASANLCLMLRIYPNGILPTLSLFEYFPLDKYHEDTPQLLHAILLWFSVYKHLAIWHFTACILIAWFIQDTKIEKWPS